MSSKEPILQLFNLPQNEIIFQDFCCAYQTRFLQYGRLFISENYVSFYASVLGINTKIVVNFNSIELIKKKTSLGFLDDAIIVQEKEGKEHKFCSFSNRDEAFEFINAIYSGQPITSIPESQDNGINLQLMEVSFGDKEDDTFSPNEPMMKSILPISVDIFFEKFFSQTAVYSLLDFHAQRGDTGIQMTEWIQNEDSWTREINAIIKLVNVPLKDKSRLYKQQSYQKSENGVLTIKTLSKTLDVPFGSYFQNEERWTVEPLEGDKCQLQCYCQMVFLKPFYLKKTIESRAKKAFLKDYENWIAQVKKIVECNQNNTGIRNQRLTLDPNQLYEESKELDIPNKKQQVFNVVKNRFNNIQMISIENLLYANTAMLGFLIILVLFLIFQNLTMDKNYCPYVII